MAGLAKYIAPLAVAWCSAMGPAPSLDPYPEQGNFSVSAEIGSSAAEGITFVRFLAKDKRVLIGLKDGKSFEYHFITTSTKEDEKSGKFGVDLYYNNLGASKDPLGINHLEVVLGAKGNKVRITSNEKIRFYSAMKTEVKETESMTFGVREYSP